MLAGALIFLFPPHIANEQHRRYLEWMGLLIICCSFVFIDAATPWPGYWALLPIIGTCLILLAQRQNSLIAQSYLCQKIGSSSYSIYLWHWPIAVAIFYLSLDAKYSIIGIALSLLLGHLSHRYIENIKFARQFESRKGYLTNKPLLITLVVCFLAGLVVANKGDLKQMPDSYTGISKQVQRSPMSKCNIGEYNPPDKACTYFGKDVAWAVFGDSHSAELSYALAEKLKPHNIGLQHLIFMSCPPSYQEPDEFSDCARWYNDAVEHLIEQETIQHIVINHRFTSYWQTEQQTPAEAARSIEQFNKLVNRLAQHKARIYLFSPVPDLGPSYLPSYRFGSHKKSRSKQCSGQL